MFAHLTRRGSPDPRFVLDPFQPAYVALEESGEMHSRAAAALEELEACRVCPRNCGVNRLRDEKRVCHIGRRARVTSVSPHFGEEDCLRGWNGSGTIFFSCCNLRCVFCQNWDISQHVAGEEFTGEEIAGFMLDLQERGCHNINLVTPEHVVPQVIEAISAAAGRGLSIPIVYNTSAYDSLASLELLNGLVDIYMPDFKCWESGSSRRYLKAKDYPDRARAALLEMQRQVGVLRFSPEGTARRGVLVRHLVMPGLLGETKAIFEWLAHDVSPNTFVNIMSQYHPENCVGERKADGSVRYGEINRRPSRQEMDEAYVAARDAGLWRFD